jgi:hypothetical protein
MATSQNATRASGTSAAQAEKRQAQKAAGTVLDLPVGAALTVADRVGELVEPWTDRETAERQLRSYRTQLTRSLKRAERRGATARRKAVTRARRTRTRLEREVRRVERELRGTQRRAETRLRQNRRQVQTTLRRNRRQVEAQLRKAEKQVGQQIASLV